MSDVSSLLLTFLREAWIALAGAFADEPGPRDALPLFEKRRRPRVEQLQHAAEESLRWFEEVDQYMHLDPLPFALSAMTRSKRIDYEKLRQRDPAFVAAVERYQQVHGVDAEAAWRKQP